MEPRQIVVYGSGGFGREIVFLAEVCNQRQDTYQVVGFADDNTAVWGTLVNDVPVMSLEKAHDCFPQAKIVVGVGSPKTRQAMVEKALHIGFDSETIIHPSVERSRWINIGKGVVICAGNILTVNIVLGDYVQINLDCTIGHDVIMNDFATLAPGVHVSGCVHLGKRVYVGTGAVIINGTEDAPIEIGDDTIIGAGACVTKSVPSNQVVVGVPARPLQK